MRRLPAHTSTTWPSINWRKLRPLQHLAVPAGDGSQSKKAIGADLGQEGSPTMTPRAAVSACLFSTRHLPHNDCKKDPRTLGQSCFLSRARPLPFVYFDVVLPAPQPFARFHHLRENTFVVYIMAYVDSNMVPGVTGTHRRTKSSLVAESNASVEHADATAIAVNTSNASVLNDHTDSVAATSAARKPVEHNPPHMLPRQIQRVVPSHFKEDPCRALRLQHDLQVHPKEKRRAYSVEQSKKSGRNGHSGRHSCTAL